MFLISISSSGQGVNDERFRCVIDELKSSIAGRDVCRSEPSIQLGDITVETEEDDGRLRLFSKPLAKRSNPLDRTEGTILLKIQFLRTGRVGWIKVVSGLNKELNKDAVEAAKRIKFYPAKISGKPTTVSRTVKYDFRIH